MVLRRVSCLVVTALLTSGVFVQADERTDPWMTGPVDDATFRTFLDFFAYDSGVPFELKRSGVDESHGLRIESVTFQSTPGVQVYAKVFRMAKSTDRGALVLLHGGGPAGKDGATVVQLATLLARAGWIVLSMDMQYFGERSTDLLTSYTEKEKHERLYNRPSAYLAWITQSVKDVRRAHDLLIEEWNADARRIGLVGFSRGAQVTSIVGGAEPRLAAVVLIHGGHFDRAEREHLPAACPANYIGRIAPRPLLMLNGERDSDYLKDTQVVPLQKLAGESGRFHWSDTGHGRPSDDDKSLMVQWLHEQLDPESPTP
jgi:dienelactone hydrolase